MSRKTFTAVIAGIAATGIALSSPIASAAPAEHANLVPDGAEIIQAGSTIFIPDVLVGDRVASKCTVGFVKNGEAYTAAHCVKVGDAVMNEKGERIGEGSLNYSSKGVDLAGIKLDKGIKMRDTPVSKTEPKNGAKVYKYGSTTGLTEGSVSEAEPNIVLSGMSLSALLPITIPMSANVAAAKLCSQPGDSGGPVISRESESVIGIVSSIDGETAKNGCHKDSVTYYTPVTWDEYA